MALFTIATLALLAGDALAKTCFNQTVTIPVSARNGVFDKISTPQTNFDATRFVLNSTRQGGNGTEKALSGYATISKKYQISTQFCVPNGTNMTGSKGPPLQILTHGIGFDKTYWDLPYNDFNYSYIDNALSHGYCTLSYDRLGIGNSSHGEPKNEIQSFLEVAALAQLTQMARNGSFPSVRQQPQKIVHVGHSFGSAISYALTANYPNISDGIILTGFSMNSTFLPQFLSGAGFQQAELSPTINSTSSYPLGYLVSNNIYNNEYLFFTPPYFDPEILAFAEKTKQPVAIGELLTVGSVPMMSPFTGPVLIITGSNDIPFCGGDCLATGGASASLPAAAKKSFPSAEKFEAYIQPNTGHGINLHYNATGAYDYIANFLKSNGVSA